MNIVDITANLVGIAVMFEHIEQFHITFRGFHRNDISTKALDGGEDIIEVRVAEMRVGLELVRDPSSRKFERINSPLEVCVPVRTTKRQLEYQPLCGLRAHQPEWR